MTQPATTNMVTLADLVAVATPAEALGIELAIATGLGLGVTSWEPLDPSRTTLQVNANLVAMYSGTVNLIAQGGFANYAAQMVDANGNPITGWMDLLTPNNYYTFRFQASQASGPVPVTNSTATTQNYSPNNPLHFQYPSSGGATYTSVGTGSIPASGSTTVTVAADPAFSGSLGNAATGTILLLATPLPGVTVQALTQPLVGAPQESNNALLVRSLNKLGTLSSSLAQVQQGTTPVPPNPAAPASAYDYVAKSIAVQPGGTTSATWPYYVSSLITRSQTYGNTSTGIVQQYIANAAGTPPPVDVAVVQAAVQALTAGQCITVNVQGATGALVAIGYTVYYRRSSGYNTAQVNAAILSALTGYFSAFPIAGITTTQANIMPFAEVEDVIFDALPGAQDLALTLNGFAANVVLGVGIVAILGTITPNVVFV